MEQLDYPSLIKIYKEERASRELTQLPDDFYPTLVRLLEQTKNKSRSSKTIGNYIQYENLQLAAKAIVEQRIQKVITFGLLLERDAIRKNYLLREEKELLEKFLNLLEEFTLNNQIHELFHRREKLRVVMTSDVPEYIGNDGKTYGPFQSGYVVELPIEEARYLIENNLAKEE